MGIVLVAFLAARTGTLQLPYNINLETHHLSHKLRIPIAFPLSVSVFDAMFCPSI